MNKFDLGIFLIILIFMLWGYYKGLVKSILSLVQYFVVVILSIVLAPMVSKLLIENFNLDLIIIEWVKNNENLVSNTINIISDEILRNIAVRIINVLAIVILFIGLKIACTFIIAILNKITNLPILNLVNKFGGLVIGAANGILIVYFLILLINWIPLESFSVLRNGIQSSVLGMKISLCVPEITTEVISKMKTSA